MLEHEPENDIDSASAAGREPRGEDAGRGSDPGGAAQADSPTGENAAPAKRVRRRAASRPAGAPEAAISAVLDAASAELEQSGARKRTKPCGRSADPGSGGGG